MLSMSKIVAPFSVVALTVLSALPWGVAAESRFVLPLLPVVAIHYWVLREHAQMVPEWFVFACGLLLDVGRLALLSVFWDEYRPILETAAERGTPLDRLESDWLGIQHAEVGSQLMEHWRLPTSVVEAIRWHHAAPECLLERKSESHFSMQAAMALASCAGDFVCSTAREPARERLHRRSLGGAARRGASASDLQVLHLGDRADGGAGARGQDRRTWLRAHPRGGGRERVDFRQR